MSITQVATRVRVPPLAHTLVHRDRLTAMLDRDVLAHKLVLVSAPAGYGKTTLLSQWAHETSLPAAWLTADSSDTYLDRFFRSLLAAWELVDPHIRHTSLGIILDGLLPDRDALLTAFINVGYDTTDHLVFVIDDAHAVDNPDINAALQYLIDYLPPHLHFVLGARGEPALPLSRYRARRELREIGVEDLRFTAEETRRFVAQIEDGTNRLDDAAVLHQQLEGWATGLQLATLLPSHQDGSNGQPGVTGHQRHIADYLRDDVLDHLTPDRRAFLVQTSIVDRLSGPLCDAITVSTGSQQVLEDLERERLFTAALDENREWFRYHRLFVDVLTDDLRSDPSTPANTLHRRASRWYLDNGMPDLAFRHAVLAEDIELAREVTDRSMLLKFFTGEVRTVQDWLEMIPESWYVSQPMFEIARSGMYFFTWRLDACAHSVDAAAQLVSASGQEMPDVSARVIAMRCFIACARNDLSAAERLAEEALETLPSHDDGFRAGVYGALGDTYRRNALWRDAQDRYRRAITFTNHPAAYVQSVNAYGALADLALQQGHLREAATHWQRALDIIEDRSTRGAYPLPVAGWVQIRFGEILYEWNDLETAAGFVSQGRERAELGGEPRSIIAGAILAARLAIARGDTVEAEALLEQVRPVAADAQLPDWSSEHTRIQVELWLAQGKLRTAATWADDQQASPGPDTQDAQASLGLTIARLRVIKGDHDASERALTELSRQIGAAEATGRLGIRIEALALRAMGHWNRGDRVSALTSLELAMRLAEPEGYIRTFADLGLTMARLLQEARRRKVMPAYVDRLLAAFAPGDLASIPSRSSLPEPLSEREREVLRNLAAGLTNREIAAALFISPETVKKHTGSIYGKLGVRGRTEAVARSLEIDLLD